MQKKNHHPNLKKNKQQTKTPYNPKPTHQKIP